MGSRLKGWALAVVLTVLAWVCDIGLRDYFSGSSSALFIIAAILAAWFGGFESAVVAVVCTVALNIIFRNHPYLSLAIGVHGIERLTIFSSVSLVASWLTARSRRSEKLLAQSNQELEGIVQRRTAALTESNQQLQ